MPKAYSSDFFVSAAVCLSKIVLMYASDLLFCHFKQVLGSCWEVFKRFIQPSVFRGSFLQDA